MRQTKCRLKGHKWHRDGAHFRSAEVCARCGEPKDVEQHQKLLEEREAWSLASEQELSHMDSIWFVMSQISLAKE